jgi:hypothetical protein
MPTLRALIPALAAVLLSTACIGADPTHNLAPDELEWLEQSAAGDPAPPAPTGAATETILERLGDLCLEHFCVRRSAEPPVCWVVVVSCRAADRSNNRQ